MPTKRLINYRLLVFLSLKRHFREEETENSVGGGYIYMYIMFEAQFKPLRMISKQES